MRASRGTAATGPLGTRTCFCFRSLLRTRCWSSGWRGRAFRSVVVVLDAGHVGDAPVVTIPPVEPIHPEEPDTRVGITDHDQAIPIPDVDAEGALHDARAFPQRR